MDPDEIAISVKTACRRGGFSRATFYRQVARGRIRLLKLGSRSLVLPSDLQRLIDELPTLVQTQEHDK